MKYLTALLIPPLAIINSGRMLACVFNSIVWVASCDLLLARRLFLPLLEDSAALLIVLSVLLWLSASVHALKVLKWQAEEMTDKKESRHLAEQMDLMKIAAHRHSSVRDSHPEA